MTAVLCITDGMVDGEAWLTHLHRRGHETSTATIATLAGLKPDWSRCGLLLASSMLKKIARDSAGFAQICRQLKAERIVMLDEPGETFALNWWLVPSMAKHLSHAGEPFTMLSGRNYVITSIVFLVH